MARSNANKSDETDLSAAIGIIPTLESEVEERKETWQDNGLEALAALANTRGGVLWIGVKDNGEPVEPNGWPDAGIACKMEAITNKIVSKLGIHPISVTIEQLKEKPVLAIRVGRAVDPVSLNGHFWRRVGNTSRQIPPEELRRFLLQHTSDHWDEFSCQFSVNALDPETIESFKSLARNRLSAIRGSEDVETVLQNLQLLDGEGNLMRAAVMLFGKDREPQRLSSTAFVQVGRFKGDGATIVDDKTIVGNLFNQLESVMAAISGMLQVRYEFPRDSEEAVGIDSIRRKEIWEYPLFALREAVANALLHRDYSLSGRVMVRIFDDHLIVSSPGTLPEGVSLQDLKRDPHVSILRNPKLAETFFYAEIVERWGSGTTRMARECKAQGLPAPEFRFQGEELWVTFRKDLYNDERLKALGLSDRQIKGVRLVQERGSISNADYREATGAPDRTASRDLKELVKSGLLASIKSGRSTQYMLAE